MGYLRKTLERRTFSQDRYENLIKRQKAGKATFKELTELDEIVNRVPDLREKVILESLITDEPEQLDDQQNDNIYNAPAPVSTRNIWKRLKSTIQRIFTLHLLTKSLHFTLPE